MISPRVAMAAGFAGAAVAAVIIAGRLDGSVVTVVALALAARAAALAASADPPHAARALGKQAALVPAWIGIAVVAAIRAGSGQLADMRGANAVAGLAIARGSTLLVIACWLALAAGAVALVSPVGGGTTAWGLAVSPDPQARLELTAVVVQAALLLTMFAGPQVRDFRDAGPWVVGAVAMAEVLWFGRRFARWDRLPRAATAIAIAAVVCAVVADRP